MNLISIDPGSTSGIVIMTIERNPKLVEHDVWKSKKDEIPSSVVDDLVRGLGVCSAAIEDQYLGKNANSMKVLVRIGGRWQEACEVHDLKVQFVSPKTWQTRILGRGNMEREQIDKMMKIVALQDTGAKLTADECAAWCIGKYAVSNILSGKHRI